MRYTISLIHDYKDLQNTISFFVRFTTSQTVEQRILNATYYLKTLHICYYYYFVLEEKEKVPGCRRREKTPMPKRT